MEPQEARLGTTVRVKEGHRKSGLAGMCGVVEGSFGGPEHPALDVRLEDGSLELFWFYQLERVEEI